MRVKQTISPEVRIKIKPVQAILTGIAGGGLATFVVSLIINVTSIQHESVAGDMWKYPFERSESLRDVNFTPLSPPVNTVHEEVRPFISANGSELFFCRRDHPQNIQGQRGTQEIWMTSLQGDGAWSAPQNLGKVVNSNIGNAICSVSPDGKEIMFVHAEMDLTRPIMKSVRKDNGWSTPQPVIIEDFYNKDQYVDFYHSYENSVLLMAVTRKDTRGEQDLYVSFPAGQDKWSKPVNLGPVVNSAESDFAPFLAADGRTLYFASYGHNGLGGCDIYRTVRLDDTWRRWSKPENLGEGINSPREESYFSITGDYKHIYFESYDLKHKVRDIFRADLPEAFKPDFSFEPTAVKEDLLQETSAN